LIFYFKKPPTNSPTHHPKIFQDTHIGKSDENFIFLCKISQQPAQKSKRGMERFAGKGGMAEEQG